MLSLAFLLLLQAAAGARPPASGMPDPGQLPVPARPDAQGLLRVDPTYFRLASETGGDFYFWDPGEFSASGLQLHLPSDAVALAYGRFQGQARRIPIPVESGVQRLVVFAGAQRKDLVVLHRPDGKVVTGLAAGEGLQTYRHMAIAAIDTPDPGVWQLELRGVGLYSVSAHVTPLRDRSAPDFFLFEFVEMRGRLAHEGWFPIGRDPRKGESLQCSATVYGDVRELAFRFVDGTGAVLAAPALRREEDGGAFYGRCVVPAVPFRVLVSGRDGAGRSFQRIGPGLHTPR